MVEKKIWEETKVEPIKPEEIVREVYHHGTVIGQGDPNEIRAHQKSFLLPASTLLVASGMKLVGFTMGHTSYEWTEEI